MQSTVKFEVNKPIEAHELARMKLCLVELNLNLSDDEVWRASARELQPKKL